MKPYGFTMLEMLVLITVLSLFFFTQITYFSSNTKWIKLQSGIATAKAWADEARRAGQRGVSGINRARVLLSEVSDLPFQSPFASDYWLYISSSQVSASFEVPFVASVIGGDIQKAIPTAHGNTIILVSATPQVPSVAAIEKHLLYQQTFLP